MKAILIKIEPKAFAKLEQMARAEKRKPGPMAAVLLERVLNAK